MGWVWRYLFDTRHGPINIRLESLNLPTPLWLSNPTGAFLGVVITDVWQWTPFMFVMILAGLQSVPKNQIEAAIIDGAKWFQIIVSIKIPHILNIILLAIVIRLIDAFKVFEVIFMMTFGGPGLSTEVISLHIYKIAFVGQQFAKAAALSVFLLMIILLIGFVLVRLNRSHHEN